MSAAAMPPRENVKYAVATTTGRSAAATTRTTRARAATWSDRRATRPRSRPSIPSPFQYVNGCRAGRWRAGGRSRRPRQSRDEAAPQTITNASARRARPRRRDRLTRQRPRTPAAAGRRARGRTRSTRAPAVRPRRPRAASWRRATPCAVATTTAAAARRPADVRHRDARHGTATKTAPTSACSSEEEPTRVKRQEQQGATRPPRSEINHFRHPKAEDDCTHGEPDRHTARRTSYKWLETSAPPICTFSSATTRQPIPNAICGI